MLLKIKHTPGKHCASTGMQNIVNFHNINFSEAMCFGIGAGLGIWYIEAPEPISLMIHVRSTDIEAQFFTKIGLPFKWEQFDDPYESEYALCSSLDNGFPVIIQTDIYHLPYFNTKTHFPGHVITVWGYNKEKEIFYITDTDRKEVINVSFENMRSARYNKNGFIALNGNMFQPTKIRFPADLDQIILQSIKYNSKCITDTSYEFQGITALEKWENEIYDWQKLKDFKWTARFTYQILEKRGTGGSAFRLLYSRFLKEAIEFLPQIKINKLDAQMVNLAAEWKKLAMTLKKASEADTPDIACIKKQINTVKNFESQYHNTVLSTL